MDVNEYATQLDQKLAGMIKEAGKGLVIVVSKWDSVEKDENLADSISNHITREFAFRPVGATSYLPALLQGKM